MGGLTPPKTERMGVAATELEFSSWGWAFRGQDVEDYGIDAHVEPFDGPDRPTGHLLALQIKSGASYLREQTDDGWWYRGTNKHLRYWLNHMLPVLVVIYEPVSKTLYWQHITEERIEYTDEAWKILIPRDQVVRREDSDRLRAIADSVRGASEDPLAYSLPLLPPSAAAVLRYAQTLEPDGTLRMARWLAGGRGQPRLTAATVLAAQPSWLSAGDGMFEAAIGAYANEHGHRDVALNAFERAAEYGSDEAGRLYGVAIVLAIGQGDPQRAAALAGRSEEAGCEGLLLSVARAALADHGQGQDIESPHVAEVLAGASEADLSAEPDLMVLLGGLAARRGDLAEALRLFEVAVAADPSTAQARLELAHALVANAGGRDSVMPAEDRLRAEALASEVQEELRRWSGPSEKALSVLLKSQMAIGAFHEVIRRATPESLGGAALDREASFGEVAVYGADAAHAIGDRVRVAGFADLVAGTPAEVFIQALLLDPAAPVPDQATAWRAALASAETMEQQRHALTQLAMLGELEADDLAVGQASGAIGECQAEIVSARNEAAQGAVDRAVMRLRRQAESNPAAAEILIEVLEKDGRTQEALAECDRAISRFGGGKITHDKLNILAAAGRLDEADAYAMSLLAGRDLAGEHRTTLRRRLIQNRADQRRWPEAEHMCREALAENQGDGDFAWALITAQANQGRLEQAWSTYQVTRPAVTRPEAVHLWLRMHCRFGFTREDFCEALDFVSRWHDAPEIGELVFSTLWEMADQLLPDGRAVLPDADPELLDRFQAEVAGYVRRYPEGSVRMIDPDNVDHAQMIWEQPKPHTGSLNLGADRVRSGELPLGALAAAANRSYATMLIEQSCGFLYAVTPDPEVFAREVIAAKKAVSGEVVLEASTLAVITLIPDRAPALTACFTAVRLPRRSLVDIEAAWRDLARIPGFSYSLSYDTERNALVSKPVSLSAHQRLFRRVIAIDQTARQLLLTDLATTDRPLDGHQTWLSAVDLAVERLLPLWSDDVAIRSIATSRGITCFGTYALLTALTELSLIPDTIEDDAVALARAGVAELALRVE